MPINRFFTATAVVALLATTPICAVAAGKTASAVRKSMEMSMLVSGTIEVNTDGRVAGYRLDHVEQLPPGVLTLIAQQVPHWTFQPRQEDGNTSASSRMGLRIVATGAGEGGYDVRIAAASFVDEQDGASVRGVQMPAPVYPRAAAMAGIKGTAYLVLKIGRDGTVADSVVEQVNLTVVGNEQQMQTGRRLLAQSARAAAQDWTFAPPTHGSLADDAYWVVRVPVDYQLVDEYRPLKEASSDTTAWRAYIPGPRTQAPWKQDGPASTGFKPDAMLSGQAYTAGTGLALLTPLKH